MQFICLPQPVSRVIFFIPTHMCRCCRCRAWLIGTKMNYLLHTGVWRLTRLTLLLFMLKKAAEPLCIAGGLCCLSCNSTRLCPELMPAVAYEQCSALHCDQHPPVPEPEEEQTLQKLETNRCQLAFATVPVLSL